MHFRNIEISQRKLFELRARLEASAGDDVAFNKSLIGGEMWEIHKLEALVNQLEAPKGNNTGVLRRLVRLGGSLGLNRKTQ